MRCYLSELRPSGISEAVVDVAGPVSGGFVQMTNRDWSISTKTLSDMLDGAPVRLINDMTALGHAVPGLAGPADEDRQSLVVNIGTGFNVCPVIEAAGKVVCPPSQMGHVHLSQSLTSALTDRFGDQVADFTFIEDCFSGRGYAHLRALWPGPGFPEFYASLIRILALDLIVACMPLSGIWFCGGVARTVLATPAGQGLCKGLPAPVPLPPDLVIPVQIIADDFAALRGCAAMPFQG